PNTSPLKPRLPPLTAPPSGANAYSIPLSSQGIYHYICIHMKNMIRVRDSDEFPTVNRGTGQLRGDIHVQYSGSICVATAAGDTPHRRCADHAADGGFR